MTKALAPPPTRIQRRRTRGWRMPSNTVYVGRGSKWGNPYRVGHPLDAEAAVLAYRDYLKGPRADYIRATIAELRGKNLACWCALGQPCHADVLLEFANRGEA